MTTLLLDSQPRSRTRIAREASSAWLAVRQARGAAARFSRSAIRRPACDLADRAAAACAIARSSAHLRTAGARRRDALVEPGLRSGPSCARLGRASIAARACGTRDAGARPSSAQMDRPGAASLSRSTPVSMPRPSSMYSTSSVATLPAGALRVGAAAEAGDRAVEHRHAEFERGVDVGERLAVGVVEMHGQPFDRNALRRTARASPGSCPACRCRWCRPARPRSSPSRAGAAATSATAAGATSPS